MPRIVVSVGNPEFDSRGVGLGMRKWRHWRVGAGCGQISGSRWVGGDMAPGTSPNDPVFYLNHCNADRMWTSWMERHGEKYPAHQCRQERLF